MKSSATVKGVYESSDLLFSVEIVEGNEEEVKYKVLGEELNQRVYIR